MICEQQVLLLAFWLSIKLFGCFVSEKNNSFLYFQFFCSSSPTENHFLLVLDLNSTTSAPISSTLNNSRSGSVSVQAGCLSVVSSPTREEEAALTAALTASAPPGHYSPAAPRLDGAVRRKNSRLALLAPAKPARTHTTTNQQLRTRSGGFPLKQQLTTVAAAAANS